MATKYNTKTYTENINRLNDNHSNAYLIPKELFGEFIKPYGKDGVYFNGTGNIIYSEIGFSRPIGEINETGEGYKIHFDISRFANHPAKKKIKDIVKKIEEVCGKFRYTPKNSGLEECVMLNPEDLTVKLSSFQYNRFNESLKELGEELEKPYTLHTSSNTNSSESHIIYSGNSTNLLIGIVNREGKFHKIDFSNKLYNLDALKARKSVLDKAKEAKNAIEFGENSRGTTYNIDTEKYFERQALYLLTKPRH